MVKESSIRDAIEIIRVAYVDAKLAEKVANALTKYLDSDVGRLRCAGEDTGVFIFELNAIMTAITHDLHLSFATSYPNRSNNSGIIHATPHYINIERLDNLDDEGSRADYIQMFDKLKDHVVIDLRYCSGGSANALYFLLCHFFPDGTPLFDLCTRLNKPRTFVASSVIDAYFKYNTVKKFTGDVKILVSGYTYSGGEIFAKTMQTHNRAKIYGTQTNGAYHPTKYIRIDDIIIHLPYVKIIDSITKKNYDGIGVTPDYSLQSPEYTKVIFTDVADNMFTTRQKN